MDQIKFYNTAKRYLEIKSLFEKYQKEIFESGIFFEGKYHELLTFELLNLKNYKYVTLCSNGTMALFIIALYYRHRFDRVYTTPISFRATYNAFNRAGYEIIYTDTDKWLMGDFKPYREGITLSVGLLGKQPILNEDNFNIEDACQNWIGSDTENTKAISFDPTKNIASCGNGGAILTYDTGLHDFAQKFIKHDSSVYGLNARMTEIECAYVYAQIPYLSSWQEQRRKLALKYNEIFKTSLFDDSKNHDIGKYVIHGSELDKAIKLGLEYKPLYPDNSYLKEKYFCLPMYA